MPHIQRGGGRGPALGADQRGSMLCAGGPHINRRPSRAAKMARRSTRACTTCGRGIAPSLGATRDRPTLDRLRSPVSAAANRARRRSPQGPARRGMGGARRAGPRRGRAVALGGGVRTRAQQHFFGRGHHMPRACAATTPSTASSWAGKQRRDGAACAIQSAAQRCLPRQADTDRPTGMGMSRPVEDPAGKAQRPCRAPRACLSKPPEAAEERLDRTGGRSGEVFLREQRAGCHEELLAEGHLGADAPRHGWRGNEPARATAQHTLESLWGPHQRGFVDVAAEETPQQPWEPNQPGEMDAIIRSVFGSPAVPEGAAEEGAEGRGAPVVVLPHRPDGAGVGRRPGSCVCAMAEPDTGIDHEGVAPFRWMWTRPREQGGADSTSAAGLDRGSDLSLNLRRRRWRRPGWAELAPANPGRVGLPVPLSIWRPRLIDG